ncbi:MAG: ABC transporter permease [Candidatus Methanomethylophilaceae archaeon]|nr:ABC transporter permease [Candidatus Methanomethylophilaceae archaeon]
MSGVASLVRRNVVCFFRDRSSVAFSLMAVMIMIALYLLFLRNTLLESNPGEGMDSLMDAWVMAGIVAIIPVTASAGCLQVMVQDRADGRERDILVTPMGPAEIASGHIVSTFVVSLTMSLVAFLVCLACLAATGCPMSAQGVLVSAALIPPSSLSGAVIIYAVTSFIRSPGAFTGFFTVVSVLIGFLAGIYMPMGTMPEAMRAVGTLLPATQMASLLRDSMAGDALDQAFARAPSDALDSFRSDMGFDLSVFGIEFDPLSSIGYIFAVSVVFFIIAAAGVKRRHRFQQPTLRSLALCKIE